uniref:Uncharacterized protein n=1 Tax=Parastrongyloides trichosuri TaxID=131310 RepID=A0A0N4ZVV0_PARTI
MSTKLGPYVGISSVESLEDDYSKDDDYIVKKIKILLLFFFVAATLLTIFVFGQALISPKREEFVKNLLLRNAILEGDEWRFTYNNRSDIGNCNYFKDHILDGEVVNYGWNNLIIKVGDNMLLRKINLDGKYFNECLSKYPKSVNFQRLCIERLSLTIINEIALSLLRDKNSTQPSVVAYCIPNEFTNYLDKLYLLERYDKTYNLSSIKFNEEGMNNNLIDKIFSFLLKFSPLNVEMDEKIKLSSDTLTSTEPSSNKVSEAQRKAAICNLFRRAISKHIFVVDRVQMYRKNTLTKFNNLIAEMKTLCLDSKLNPKVNEQFITIIKELNELSLI